jgi:gelsolin
VQGYESPHFLSYFRRFVCLKGGVSTGFHHVSEEPPADVHRLYRIIFTKTGVRTGNLVVREVPPVKESLIEGDVYVLDKGSKILQLNTKEAAGQEKFKAAEFVQSLVNERKIHPTVSVSGKRCLHSWSRSVH